MITIGSVVQKKSGKPFQNKEKTAVVVDFGSVAIPYAHWMHRNDLKVVECAHLAGCDSPVVLSGLEEVENS